MGRVLRNAGIGGLSSSVAGGVLFGAALLYTADTATAGGLLQALKFMALFPLGGAIIGAGCTRPEEPSHMRSALIVAAVLLAGTPVMALVGELLFPEADSWAVVSFIFAVPALIFVGVAQFMRD